MVLLYSSDRLGTYFEYLAGFELRDLYASASQELRLKECATIPSFTLNVLTMKKAIVLLDKNQCLGEICCFKTYRHGDKANSLASQQKCQRAQCIQQVTQC